MKSALKTKLSGLEVTEAQLLLLIQYVDNLVKFNKAVQLTRISNMDTWVTNHIEDSCRAFFQVDSSQIKRFYDFGSGNGLPAVVFAVLSGKSVISFDKDERKMEFIKFIASRLKLDLSSRVLDFNEEKIEVPRGTMITYRGLGPEKLLEQLQRKYSESVHLRFCSEQQGSLWKNSKRVSYTLSDRSKRSLEVST